jgi:hypothetical protein
MLDFSESYHSEANYLLHQLAALLPNLEQMLMVYPSVKHKQLQLMEINEENPVPNQLIADQVFDYYLLERLFERRRSVQWLSAKALPWRKQRAQLGQQEVFGELENSVLLIRTSAEKNHPSYLFLFFFNPDATNFGPVRNDEVLSTSSKTILEQMIFRSIKTAQRSFLNQQKQFSLYQKYLSRLKDKTKYIASQHKKAEQATMDLKLDFAQYTLDELGKNIRTELAFSASAQELIQGFTGSFKAMKSWIAEAFEFAHFTDMQQQMVLVIDDWHFKETELYSSEEQKEKAEQHMDQRYYKVFALLNRIEKAALKVASERKKLTSAAVGQAMEPPISAPAISDAFRKNQKKILHLLEHYPGNWGLIRRDFKPLSNIIVRSSHSTPQIKAS